MIDEEAVSNEISGFVRGVALLGLNQQQLEQAGLPLSSQSDFFRMAVDPKEKS